MKFDVYRLFSSEVQFTAEIDCDEGELNSVKLGLAVRWAFKNGARLVGASLDGARLVGARLVGASLDGARLVGARLVGASLDGARLVGASLVGVVARATRSDGYEFIALSSDRGIIIRAGCRTFLIDEYRKHVAGAYPGTPKARETVDILDFIQKRSEA